MNTIKRLEYKTTTSRARDTYGYTVVTLLCDGKRWKTCGGGYDMRGTVLADYFAESFPFELMQLVNKNLADLEPCNYAVEGYHKLKNFYGLTINPTGKVLLDGGCGINCIEKIIRACGFELEYAVNPRGNITTYYLQAVAA